MAAMTEIVDDAALVRRFCAGDHSAFERIVQNHSADVAKLANRLLGWPGDVDDITQEVFLAAFIGLKRFRLECKLKTWLFAITTNKCRTARLKRTFRLHRFARKTEPPVELPDCPTEDHMLDQESFERVRTAIRELPSSYREPIVLRYLQELETDEICRILGISPNALQVRLNRARSRLRKQVGALAEE